MKPIDTILNVSQNYFIQGGSDAYYFMLESLLTEHGHRVVPFAARHPGNLRNQWEDRFPRGADFIHPGILDLFMFLYSLPARKAIIRLINDIKIDIAHFHIYYGKITASVLTPLKKAGIPLVQTLHEYKLLCPVYTLVRHGRICEDCAGRHFWKAAYYCCNRHSLARSLLSACESYVSRAVGSMDKIDHFIAVSDFIRTRMIDHGLHPDKITTIHNFVDTKRFHAGYATGQHFLYFGRLERLKGLYTLLRAAALIPKTPMIVAGTGPEKENLERWVKCTGLKHIRFVGFQTGQALHDLIRNSICTILPSQWYENCPVSVLESFALGTPVIGTDMGGIPELIRHGQDGWIVPSQNVESLATAMQWMEEHHKAAAEMGRSGRKKVETQFRPDLHYRKLLNVYQRL